MLVSLIQSALGRIGRAARRFNRNHAKKLRDAAAIRHLESLPAYLHRDVGLPQDAAIADVVEGAAPRRSAVADAHRPLAIEPHAV